MLSALYQWETQKSVPAASDCCVLVIAMVSPADVCSVELMVWIGRMPIRMVDVTDAHFYQSGSGFGGYSSDIFTLPSEYRSSM